MAEEAQTEGDGAAGEVDGAAKKKKGLMGPLMIGVVAALLLGGGAAYGVMSGLIPLGDAPAEEHAAGEGAEKGHGAEGGHGEAENAEKPVFVGFEPLTVTLTRGGAPRQLRLELSVETDEHHSHDVEEMKPRILDALNTLLRAMDERELTEPAALDRLRGQMLRRVRIATDPNAVKDLLITEFVVF